jgi:hypothetical protein
MTPELIELADKFAKEWHLSVPEQRSLPEGGIPADLLVSRISAILQSKGSYPFDWKPADGFDGGLIVREGAKFRIYWKVEAGVSRFELKETQEFPDPDLASRVWAKRFFGSGFDGIKINWNR